MEQNAAQYLQQKINDLKESQRNIKSRISEMQTIHEVQEIEIAALEGALKKLPTPATRSINGKGASAAMAEIKNLGFRDALRYVLAHARKGMKPKQIADELQRLDYPYTAKVLITTRVSNELYRMSETGNIGKRAGLYYAKKGASP